VRDELAVVCNNFKSGMSQKHEDSLNSSDFDDDELLDGFKDSEEGA